MEPVHVVSSVPSVVAVLSVVYMRSGVLDTGRRQREQAQSL
jgi:hypothetical protein